MCRLTPSTKAAVAFFSKVPAIGDLQRLRRALGSSFAKTAAPIAAHDLDVGMGGEPVCDGTALPVRQEADGAASLQVADDRSTALAPQPGEIIGPDHANIGRRRWCAPPQEAQQRADAHRHGKAFGEHFGGPAAEREGVGEPVEARGPSRMGLDEAAREALREDPALAC
jgi:hypothetical protein